MVVVPPGLARKSNRPSRGTVILGFVLALILSLETGQILVEAQDFAPNLGSRRMASLRAAYWPESPIPTDDQGDALADWIGLERYLAVARLDSDQARALAAVEDRAAEAAREALKGYTRLLEPLTPSQRAALEVPQGRVVDHLALGLDSVGWDLELLWLHRTDERAAESKVAAPSAGPVTEPMRMAPTRLAVSLTRLLDDPRQPITPAQARAILERVIQLRGPLEDLHKLQVAALRLLTNEQRQAAQKLELRRWEAFPSPQALELFLQMVQQRRPGAAAS